MSLNNEGQKCKTGHVRRKVLVRADINGGGKEGDVVNVPYILA
jgi:hypothetical protein